MVSVFVIFFSHIINCRMIKFSSVLSCKSSHCCIWCRKYFKIFAFVKISVAMVTATVVFAKIKRYLLYPNMKKIIESRMEIIHTTTETSKKALAGLSLVW